MTAATVDVNNYKNERNDAIQAFLAKTKWANATREHLTGDSSIRSYDRLTLDGKSYVLMNAPTNEANLICLPGMTEAQRIERGYYAMRRLAGARIDAVVCIAEWLREQGLSVPEIYEFDAENGFAVIEDYGDGQAWSILEKDLTPERDIYRAGAEVLVKLDPIHAPSLLRYRGLTWNLFRYDRLAMDTEAELLLDWYAGAHCGITVDDAVRKSYIEAFHSMYRYLGDEFHTLALRDYHSPNMMWLPERKGAARIGIIDFQDSMLCNRAHNLMFLINDARRVVSPDVARETWNFYIKESKVDLQQFEYAYNVYAAVNNCRLLGTFSRLKYKFELPGYMVHVPRVMGYIQTALRHPACAPLASWFNTYLPDMLKDAA